MENCQHTSLEPLVSINHGSVHRRHLRSYSDGEEVDVINIDTSVDLEFKICKCGYMSVKRHEVTYSITSHSICRDFGPIASYTATKTSYDTEGYNFSEDYILKNADTFDWSQFYYLKDQYSKEFFKRFDNLIFKQNRLLRCNEFVEFNFLS